MTTYAGNGGTFTFATSAVTELRSWTLNAEVDILDDTAMGDNWETKKGGIGRWDGSATAWLDYGDSTQAAIIADIAVATPSGDSVAAVFQVATSKTFTGNVIVRSFSISQAKEGIAEVTFNFVGNAALSVSWT